MADSKKETHGTFVSGFSLGLFLGASGYFMFNTKEGNKLKEKLAAEWDEVRVFLASAGLIPSAEMSISDLASYLMEHGEKSMAAQLTVKQSEIVGSKSNQKEAKQVKTKPEKKKTPPKTKRKAPAKKNRFKGV